MVDSTPAFQPGNHAVERVFDPHAFCVQATADLIAQIDVEADQLAVGGFRFERRIARIDTEAHGRPVLRHRAAGRYGEQRHRQGCKQGFHVFPFHSF
jgi:hypothetical protein